MWTLFQAVANCDRSNPFGHRAIGWRIVSRVGVIDDLSIHRIGPRPTISRNASVSAVEQPHRPAHVALPPVGAREEPAVLASRRPAGVGADGQRHRVGAPAAGQPVVAGREHGEERGEHQAQRGGHPVVAAQAVLEGVLVDEQQHGHRRVRRPAAGEQERLGEQLGRGDQLQDQRHEQHVPQLRQRDVAGSSARSRRRRPRPRRTARAGRRSSAAR